MAEQFNARKSFDADYRIGFFERNRQKVTPDSIYVVQRNDWLDSISYSAYGYDRTSDIIAANDFLQKRPYISNPKDPTDLPLPNIAPGDNIYIPPAIEEKIADTIETDDPESIIVRLNGQIFRDFDGFTVNRNLDTVADSFSFSAPLNESFKSFPYLEPFADIKAEIFVGGELYLTGKFEKWGPSIADGITTIEGRSLSGKLIDCQSPGGSLSYSGTLRQIANSVLRGFGLTAQFPDGDSSFIQLAEREATDTVFDFLSKYAPDQGFKLTSDVFGDPAFVRAAINSEPVDSFEQGDPPLLSVSCDYDMTQRFSQITGVSQSTGNPSNNYTVSDPSILSYRPKTFSASTTTGTNIENAVKWELSKSLADAAACSITVAGFRNRQGNVWRENMKIQLRAPGVHIYRTTDYIIKNVTLKKSISDGNVTELQLVIPESFTGEFPKELPWERQ